MSVERFAVGILVMLCTLLSSSALLGVSAFAEEAYVPGASFGEPGTGPSQFDEPVGVAVNDGTGDVYVVNKGNNRVEYFSAGGAYNGEFNGSGLLLNEGKEAGSGGLPVEIKTGQFAGPEDIAVDNDASSSSFGDVYVADTGHHVIDKFSASGEYLGQLTNALVCEYGVKSCEKNPEGKCEAGDISCENLPFASLLGVATDSAGNVWVYQVRRDPHNNGQYGFVTEFDNMGNSVESFRLGTIPMHGITVNPCGSLGEIYLDEEPVQMTGVYDAKTAHHIGWSASEKVVALTAVPAGSIQLSCDAILDLGDSLAVYSPITKGHQEPLAIFPGEIAPENFPGFSESYGVAVNALAVVYASERGADRVQSFHHIAVPVVVTEAPSGVTTTELTLHGSVNPEGQIIVACSFQYSTEENEYTNEKPCSGEEVKTINENKTASHAVSVTIGGLAPTGVRGSRFVVVAEGPEVPRYRSYGKGIVVSRPAVADESVSDVGTATARVDAEIDPGGLAGCWWVEYGSGTEYTDRVPSKGCMPVAEGNVDVPVGVELGSLEPSAGYHFRTEASNGLGVTSSVGVSFATFPAASSAPADRRVYELVSPVVSGEDRQVYAPVGMERTLDFESLKHDLATFRPFEASENGEAVAYVGDPPSTGGNGNVGESGGNEWVSKRMAGDGWSALDLELLGVEKKYVAFSDDLSLGVLESEEPLAAEAPVGYPNLFVHATAAGAGFEPLLTEAPENRTPKEYTPHFDGWNSGVGVGGAFYHRLIEANAALRSAPQAPEVGKFENDLYDNVKGHGELFLVSVLPNGGPAENAAFDREGIENDIKDNGLPAPETSGIISADGSRIFWSAMGKVEVAPGHFDERPVGLYVRENDTQEESPVGENGECLVPADACTVQLDLSELPGDKEEKEKRGAMVNSGARTVMARECCSLMNDH